MGEWRQHSYRSCKWRSLTRGRGGEIGVQKSMSGRSKERERAKGTQSDIEVRMPGKGKGEADGVQRR